MGGSVMPKSIKKFKSISWENTYPGQRVSIAGNLINGKPTRVYGPHIILNANRKLLISSMNGNTFREDWPCVYVPKKRIQT